MNAFAFMKLICHTEEVVHLYNLIIRGKKTHISAIKMTSELDGGPIYLKHKLSLIGLAEDLHQMLRNNNRYDKTNYK